MQPQVFLDRSSGNRNTLFIGNLSVFATPEDVLALFGKYGEIRQVRMKPGSDGRSNNGYTFVEFMNNEAAALTKGALHGAVFMGRALRIEWARLTSEPPVQQRRANTHGYQVLVSFACRRSGLRIHEGVLYSLLSSYGPIVDISIKRNNQHEIDAQGLHSGYGFVTFDSSDAGYTGAIAAINSIKRAVINDFVYDCQMSRSMHNAVQERENQSAAAMGLTQQYVQTEPLLNQGGAPYMSASSQMLVSDAYDRQVVTSSQNYMHPMPVYQYPHHSSPNPSVRQTYEYRQAPPSNQVPLIAPFRNMSYNTMDSSGHRVAAVQQPPHRQHRAQQNDPCLPP